MERVLECLCIASKRGDSVEKIDIYDVIMFGVFVMMWHFLTIADFLFFLGVAVCLFLCFSFRYHIVKMSKRGRTGQRDLEKLRAQSREAM